jgi:catechol 2,3-dioxygenase-like lactoylglutathione lyase family enzyme
VSHRLRALAANTSSPEDQADLHRALDPAGIVMGPTHAEIRFSDGLILRYLRSDTPSRTHLGFGIADLAGAAERLEGDLGIRWTCTTPGVIDSRDCDGNRVYLVGLTGDPGDGFPQRDQRLIAATLFVSDVPASARWWRALGLSVGDASNLVGSVPVDAHDPSADVFFGSGPVIQLWPAGPGLSTVAHIVIGVDDEAALDAAALGLDELGWEYRREPGAVNAYTPDGVGVRLTAPTQRD